MLLRSASCFTSAVCDRLPLALSLSLSCFPLLRVSWINKWACPFICWCGQDVAQDQRGGSGGCIRAKATQSVKKKNCSNNHKTAEYRIWSCAKPIIFRLLTYRISEHRCLTERSTRFKKKKKSASPVPFHQQTAWQSQHYRHIAGLC